MPNFWMGVYVQYEIYFVITYSNLNNLLMDCYLEL